MLGESDLNSSSSMDAFQTLLKFIEQSSWRPALQKACRIYNVKAFNIEKLTPEKVRELYKRIHERFYSCQRPRNGIWIENQLRVFIWILIIATELKNVSPEAFSTEDWASIAKIFEGKSVQTCKFQYKSIANQKATPWDEEQDELLRAIIQKRNEINPNWNQISRDLFSISGEKHFKTSKQCREHWNNYLNPNVLKTNWDKKQDYLLMKYVVEKGKQWASISKYLSSTRTEHMVKNRFKSLVLAYSKENNISKKLSESLPVLQRIFRKIKAELEETQQLDQQNQVQIKQEKQRQSQTGVGLFRSAFQLVSGISPGESTALSLGSSTVISPGPSLAFQFSASQVFSRFMLPVPLYGLQPEIYIPGLVPVAPKVNKAQDQ